MKTIFRQITVLTVLVTSIGTTLHVHNISNDSFIANVDALAKAEGTDVDYCYIDNREYGQWDTAVFCNRETDSDTIYPCESETWGYKSKGLTDRCTK